MAAKAHGKYAPLTAWDWATAVLLLGILALTAFTVRDYGVTYDEEWHRRYGEYAFAWYRSGFEDRRALTFWNMVDKGALFNTLAYAASRLSPLTYFETAHFLSALFSLLSMACVWALGRFLSGPRAGFFAALLLAATPPYYGHGFLNATDMPVAALCAGALYFLVRFVAQLPRPTMGTALGFGVMCGLALGVRLSALVLAPYALFGVGVWAVLARQPKAVIAAVPRLLRLGAAAVVTAYGVMLACWPAAMASPIRHPYQALYRSTHFEYALDVFFDGKTIKSDALPWDYLPRFFVITMPELYLMGWAAAAAVAGAALIRQGAPGGSEATPKARSNDGLNSDPGRTAALATVGLAALFPLVYTAIMRPVNHDGIRHFLFVVPPLATVAALGFDAALQRAPKPAKVALLSAACLALGVTVSDMVQLHPHQYLYFNRAVAGGLPGAAARYETDYWGSTYREGAEWLQAHYPPQGQRKVRVGSCSHSQSTEEFLKDPRFEYVGSLHDGKDLEGTPDIMLATTRWNCDKRVVGNVVHEVVRQQTPLLYAIEVDHILPEDAFQTADPP